jgi:hypothetical protein
VTSPFRPVVSARLPALAWPLPALAAWGAAWALWSALRHLGTPAAVGWALACAAGGALALAWPGLARWRRVWLGVGFPASSVGLGLTAGLPAWAWLLPLGLLLLAYPLRAWRDAPLFPTPARALAGLALLAPLPAGASVLDAGCGLGQGLRAQREQYPEARLAGIEWSPLLALAARWRCRDAAVRRGDLWADDWAAQDLVYLFQRPESMARAWDKACAEMVPGCWLVSLDFAVPDVPPTHVLETPGGPALWLYRIPAPVAPRSSGVTRRR